MAEFFRGLRVLSVEETKQYDCPYPADPEDQEEERMFLLISIDLPKGEKNCNGKKCCRFFSGGSEPWCGLFMHPFKEWFYKDIDKKDPIVPRCDACRLAAEVGEKLGSDNKAG
jgi:hypothetical protein